MGLLYLFNVLVPPFGGDVDGKDALCLVGGTVALGMVGDELSNRLGKLARKLRALGVGGSLAAVRALRAASRMVCRLVTPFSYRPRLR